MAVSVVSTAVNQGILQRELERQLLSITREHRKEEIRIRKVINQAASDLTRLEYEKLKYAKADFGRTEEKQKTKIKLCPRCPSEDFTVLFAPTRKAGKPAPDQDAKQPEPTPQREPRDSPVRKSEDFSRRESDYEDEDYSRRESDYGNRRRAERYTRKSSAFAEKRTSEEYTERKKEGWGARCSVANPNYVEDSEEKESLKRESRQSIRWEDDELMRRKTEESVRGTSERSKENTIEDTAQMEQEEPGKHMADEARKIKSSKTVHVHLQEPLFADD